MPVDASSEHTRASRPRPSRPARGIGVLWLGAYLFGLHLDGRDILITGSISGVFGGLLLAFTFDRLVGISYRRFVMPAIPNGTGSA